MELLPALFRGLLAGSSMLVGAAASAIPAMIAGAVIPQAFDDTHDTAGLTTAAGFITALYVLILWVETRETIPDLLDK